MRDPPPPGADAAAPLRRATWDLLSHALHGRWRSGERREARRLLPSPQWSVEATRTRVPVSAGSSGCSRSSSSSPPGGATPQRGGSTRPDRCRVLCRYEPSALTRGAVVSPPSLLCVPACPPPSTAAACSPGLPVARRRADAQPAWRGMATPKHGSSSAARATSIRSACSNRPRKISCSPRVVTVVTQRVAQR